MKLTHINLALSNRCNAKCIWCPTSRGTNHNFDMPKEIAFKIIDEASQFDYDLDRMHFSENGEAIYNKDFIEILSYAKQKLPNTKLNMLSNFGMMTRKLSEDICKTQAIYEFQLNIDGHDADSYRAVKKISYNTVIRNLKYFLNMREKYHPDMRFVINVMPAFEYSITVNALFRDAPHQVQNDEVPYSNFEEVKASLKHIIEPYNVHIRHSQSGFWAERKTFLKNKEKINLDQSKMDCPMFDRVQHEAYIAPNGAWYPCCLDDNNDIVLGNVKFQTVQEIFESQRRLEFIKKLKNRQYEEIGYPCNTVACCQSIKIPDAYYNDMTKGFTVGKTVKFQPEKG